MSVDQLHAHLEETPGRTNHERLQSLIAEVKAGHARRLAEPASNPERTRLLNGITRFIDASDRRMAEETEDAKKEQIIRTRASLLELSAAIAPPPAEASDTPAAAVTPAAAEGASAVPASSLARARQWAQDHPRMALGGLGIAAVAAALSVHSLFSKSAPWMRSILLLGGSAAGGTLLWKQITKDRSKESAEADGVAPRIEGVMGRVHGAIDDVLGGSLEREVRSARNREGKTPEQYHRDAIFTPPADGKAGTEQPGVHRARVHIVPGGLPRPIIFIVGGNRDRLYDPNPHDDRNIVYGTRHMFEQLAATNKYHVVQLRVGEELSADGKLNNAVAFEHVRNFVGDALRGKGVFKDCRISEARFAGYSYGAGAVSNVLDPAGGVIPPHVSVGATAFLDGIKFRSAPPEALTTAPASSGRHFHAWQPHKRFGAAYAAGKPLEGKRAQDVTLDLEKIDTAIDHYAITNAQREDIRDKVYKPVLGFMTKDEARAR